MTQLLALLVFPYLLYTYQVCRFYPRDEAISIVGNVWVRETWLHCSIWIILVEDLLHPCVGRDIESAMIRLIVLSQDFICKVHLKNPFPWIAHTSEFNSNVKTDLRDFFRLLTLLDSSHLLSFLTWIIESWLHNTCMVAYLWFLIEPLACFIVLYESLIYSYYKSSLLFGGSFL